MTLKEVIKYFKDNGLEERIVIFDESTATAALAAQALGCEESRIAKSITFKDKEGGAIMIVTSGVKKIDSKKFKSVFGARPKMLTPEEVVELIGYHVGGVCPFLVREGCKVYIDESLKEFDFVYPACGSDNSTIKLSIPELIEHSKALNFVDVCK